jgi:hypothetical protein
MTLDFPNAALPFLSASVVVLASGPERGSAADAVRVEHASVRAGNPMAQAVGAADGEQWTVTFREADWISPRRISNGCVVEPDLLSRRWPRLTVQRHQTLAGMVVLECSAKERARK